MKWLKWNNVEEYGEIYCPMLDKTVMTYCPIGCPPFDSYTAPFIDEAGEICYYDYDHDYGSWEESTYTLGNVEEFDGEVEEFSI